MGGVRSRPVVNNPTKTSQAPAVSVTQHAPVSSGQSASKSLEETLNDYLDKQQNQTEEDRHMIIAYLESLDSGREGGTGGRSQPSSANVTYTNPQYVSHISYDEPQYVLSVAAYNEIINGSTTVAGGSATTNQNASDQIVLSPEAYDELIRANSPNTGSCSVDGSQTTGSPTSTGSPMSTVVASKPTVPGTRPDLVDNDTTNIRSDYRELLRKLTAAIRCPICQKFFANPRTLPNCQHSFCHRCIVSYIKKSSMETNNSLACPVCRQVSVLPPDGVGSLDTNESIRLFMSEMQAQAARRSFPENWSKAMPTITTNGRTARYFYKEALESTSQEYKSVEENARRSAQGCISEIVSIHRIQNAHQYQLYAVQRSHVLGNQPHDDKKEMRILWHGTKSSNVDDICRRGFNRAYAGLNGARFGRGTYFAVDFNYSATDSYSRPETAGGLKNVLQCRVLVGDYTTGSEGMVVPPRKRDSMELYDSVVDDVNNPKIFVVFYDARAYPDYLITFRAQR